MSFAVIVQHYSLYNKSTFPIFPNFAPLFQGISPSIDPLCPTLRYRPPLSLPQRSRPPPNFPLLALPAPSPRPSMLYSGPPSQCPRSNYGTEAMPGWSLITRMSAAFWRTSACPRYGFQHRTCSRLLPIDWLDDLPFLFHRSALALGSLN